MTDPKPTLNDPLATRFMAWIHERFPFANALLFFILYLATAAVARANLGGAVSFNLGDVLNSLLAWSFFLLLRVFDEHKDFALDCLNHPQRVLQSGLISLKHLQVAAAIAIAAQLSYSLWLDRGFGATSTAWLMLFGWTCLMGKELFIADWLTRHLTWYALSHMLVMLPIVWWLANLAVPGVTLSLPLIALMSLAFISGFCFEITRKTKGPEEERDSIESYSRIFGTRGSALVVIALVSAMSLNQLWLIYLLVGQVPLWAPLLLLALYALALRQLLSFIRAPSAALRSKNEACVALTMLAGYAVLIAVVAIEHGLSLNLL